MSYTEQDHRAGPKLGSRTAFTFIVDVLPGHEQTLRDLIAADQGNPDGVKALHEIGTLHEFRWVLLDDDRRLMFASAFDGSWEKYIQDFASTQIGELIDRNLQHVEGWIGIQDPGAADWLLDRAVPAVALWDDGGTDNHWTTAANRVGDIAPSPAPASPS